MDAAGHLYAAVANRIVVYSPWGEQVAEMPLPPEAEKASNLCFGHGQYRHTLFITAAKRLYTLQTELYKL